MLVKEVWTDMKNDSQGRINGVVSRMNEEVEREREKK